MRLGPRGALGYAIQRGTPGSESIQSAVTLSSFEIKVTRSRDVSIAAVSPARVAWRYRWVKGKAPVGGPGLHFLEGAFLHGALGGHPPSFSVDINFNARHLASFRGAQEFFRRQRSGSPRRIAKMNAAKTDPKFNDIIHRVDAELKRLGFDDIDAFAKTGSLHKLNEAMTAAAMKTDKRFQLKANMFC
jgi:hypothetical protein